LGFKKKGVINLRHIRALKKKCTPDLTGRERGNFGGWAPVGEGQVKGGSYDPGGAIVLAPGPNASSGEVGRSKTGSMIGRGKERKPTRSQRKSAHYSENRIKGRGISVGQDYFFWTFGMVRGRWGGKNLPAIK